MAIFRGGRVRVALPRLGQQQSALREDIEALGGELDDDAPFCRPLLGPLVKLALWPAEGDLVAPSPALVGEEAEDGVLLRFVYTFHVRCHVFDVDGVLFLSFLFGGAW